MAKKSVDELFVQELQANAHRIYGYIFSLVPDRFDAEEIFQETCTVLWQKCDSFVPGTSFRALAFQIAVNKVRQHRRTKQKDRLVFSDQFVDAVEQDYPARTDQLDRERQALRQCLAKLSKTNRDLISHRYGTSASIQSLATTLGRTAASLYQALSRIRAFLLNCVQQTLIREDQP